MDRIVTFLSQGQTVLGNLRVPFESAPCVIMSHGLEGNKDGTKWQLLATKLFEGGIASLRFNYRGCGQGEEKSQGDFEESTLSDRIKDFKAAIDFIKETEVDGSRLGVVGSSLGGVVSVAAWDKTIKAMVLLATPYHFPQPTQKQLEHIDNSGYFELPSGKKMGIGFLKELWGRTIDREIKNVECPLLIIHGSADNHVPIDDAKQLYEKANEPKRLEIIRDGSHCFDDPANLQQVASLVCNWLRRYLVP